MPVGVFARDYALPMLSGFGGKGEVKKLQIDVIEMCAELGDIHALLVETQAAVRGGLAPDQALGPLETKE